MNIAKDTRTAIIDVALDLVQRQSISGVSFQELAKRVGIKKGSMYYHFETKDDLSIAILARASQDMKTSFERSESLHSTERLDNFFSIYSRFIGPGEKLCPGGAFAGEWEKLSEHVRSYVNKLFDVQVIGIKKIVEAGFEEGEFISHNQSPEVLALWVVSCLQGALLTSRVMESHVPFDAAVNVIRSYLKKS